MSRTLPYLAELQPEMFCEVSPRAGGRARARARRLGDDRHRARGDRGARAGHRPDPAAAGRRPGRRTRSGCPTTGAAAASRQGDSRQRPRRVVAGPERPHPGGEGGDLRRPAGPPPARAGADDVRRGLPPAGRRRTWTTPRTGGPSDEQLAVRPAGRRPGRRGVRRHPPRMGFFTDTTVCIGCKACEVACKEWNEVPDDGYELHRDVLRQHRGARREHLAARRVRRAARRAEAAHDRPTSGCPAWARPVRWRATTRAPRPGTPASAG